jgi:hypothetical protein
MRNSAKPIQRWGEVCFQSFLGKAISKRFLVGLLFIILVGDGCKSVSHYVSPRVEGRVLDSASRQPIEGVEVQRLAAENKHRTSQPMKGGQLMMEAPVNRTAMDGTFVMDSQRTLGFFKKAGWYSVRLSFRHSAYKSFTATYTVAQSTNSVDGEPLVKTGDICLHPLAK